jgi:cystathionine gamma-synthase
MSDLPNEPTNRGSATSSVHAGELRQQEANAITTPIYQTSTFWFRNSKEVTDYQEGKSKREEYGRYGNPTWRSVERKISALEGGEETILFASGMCAATTAFMALLPEGSHLIVTSDCYRRTRQFINQFLSRMSVETTVIEPSNLDAFEAAIRPNTELFFTESPTNPYLRVVDVPAFTEVAHANDVKVIIDSTFATPVNHKALSDGADLVLHSATKYLGGHNDLLAGTVTGPRELIEPVRSALGVLGGIIDAHAAWLLLRGIKTLDIRMERHNSNGLALATYLESHPKIRKVWYPGLESHPDHAIAKRMMNGAGGVVTFEIETELEGAMRFIDATTIPYQAPSLGGVESLIELPVTMSFWDVPKSDRLELGITDSLVRYACGIENASDIIADIEQALTKV